MYRLEWQHTLVAEGSLPHRLVGSPSDCCAMFAQLSSLADKQRHDFEFIRVLDMDGGTVKVWPKLLKEKRKRKS